MKKITKKLYKKLFGKTKPYASIVDEVEGYIWEAYTDMDPDKTNIVIIVFVRVPDRHKRPRERPGYNSCPWESKDIRLLDLRYFIS